MKIKNNLLVICDQLTQGGLETHVYTQIESLQKLGYVVHLAVGKNYLQENRPLHLKVQVHHLNLNSNLNLVEFAEDVRKVRQIIIDFEIKHVMAHPFTAPLITLAATPFSDVTTSITLHGPASLNLGNLNVELAKKIILLFDLIIFVSRELEESFGQVSGKTLLSNNSVHFDSAFKRDVYSTLDLEEERWLLVSRLDDDKFPGIEKFFTELLGHPQIRVDVIGEGNKKADLESQVLSNSLRDRVRFLGNSNHVREKMREYSVVVGMGRVAIEGIAEQKNVLLLGYQGVIGFLDSKLAKSAENSNFSGRGLPSRTLSCALENRANSLASAQETYENMRLKHDLNSNSQYLAEVLETLSPQPRNLVTNEISLLKTVANLQWRNVEKAKNIKVSDFLETVGEFFSKEPEKGEAFTVLMSGIKGERDVLLGERDVLLGERDVLLGERDVLLGERDVLLGERDVLLGERDVLLGERDVLLGERDVLLGERDALLGSQSWKITKPLRKIANLFK